MSSLAAAKADNFYYPPDFDPQKHKTLNKVSGPSCQHLHHVRRPH